MKRRSWLRLLAAVGFVSVSAAADPAPALRVLDASPVGPFEVRVSFDQPVGNDVARAALGKTIAFDTRRPTVATPSLRGDAPEAQGAIRIAAARLDGDGKTLVLTTDPHPRAAAYTLRLPRPGSVPIVVEYDLSGVQAEWDDGKEGSPLRFVGRWKSLSPTSASKEVVGLLAQKGRFTLSTLVILPKGSLTVRITATASIEATLGGEEPALPEGLDAAAAPSGQVAVFRVESTGDPNPLTLSIRTGGLSDKPTTVRMIVRTGKNTGAEADVRPEQFLLPWTPAEPPPAPPLENVPNLAGGDPVKGHAVFKGAEAKCASCHRVRGEGAEIGPDLSALVGRDRTEVYRDIYAPSARIHPDYVSYTIALKGGRVVVGTVRAEGADAVRVIDTEAKVAVLQRSEIEEFRPSATSIMPVGLAGAIGADNLRDLIAYLTTPPAK